MKQARPLATLLAERLQAIYEHNRVPETWGAPSASRPTFDLLRTEGLWVAGRCLLQRLQETGRPDLSTIEKLTALLAGVIINEKGLHAHARAKCTKAYTARSYKTFSGGHC